MKGKFVNVRKYLSTYCFILGNDGIEYFCHKDNFISKKDYNNYCYNGNTCEFDYVTEDDSVRPRAINIVPTPIRDPNEAEKRAYKEEMKHNAEVKKAKKEHNIKVATQKKDWKDYKDSHLMYVVGIKPQGSSKWYAFNPILMSAESPEECKININKLKETYKDCKFRVIKALVFSDFGVVREYKTYNNIEIMRI